MEVPQKTKNGITIWSSNPTLGHFHFFKTASSSVFAHSVYYQGLSGSPHVPVKEDLLIVLVKKGTLGRHKASDTSIPVKKDLAQGLYLQRLLEKQSLHSQRLQLCGCYRCSCPAESRSALWRRDKCQSPSQRPFKVSEWGGCFRITEFTLELSSHQELPLFLSPLKRKCK